MMISFTTFLGITIVSYKKKQIAYIDMLIAIGDKVQMLLKNTSPDTTELLSRLKSDERLKHFDFELNDNSILLENDAKSKVKEFFYSIGRYDIETQINLSKEFTAELRLLKEEYQQYLKSHQKLYVAFGLLSGVLFSVIII
ncbi:MAG: stage III sporulation protein AB [Acetobacter sp.]|nr:stage III sporulation protein AB [Bacteroides sp.]MCM1340600.1 stage III sporulation protein AB [Acetobacter sp.]